jgi:hypothetical protein
MIPGGMKQAIALLLLICSELSGAMDGNTLLKACTDEDHSNDKAICMGYVVAVADALNVGVGGSKACFPNGLTYGQLVDVAKKSLSEHPDVSQHYEAFGLVARALIESFPCTSTR